jgi:hypothetical protein
MTMVGRIGYDNPRVHRVAKATGSWSIPHMKAIRAPVSGPEVVQQVPSVIAFTNSKSKKLSRLFEHSCVVLPHFELL